MRSPSCSRQPPIEAVVATLLNDLSASSNDVVLVLDDYHSSRRAKYRREWPSFWSICPRRYTWCSPAAPTPRCRYTLARARRTRRGPCRGSALCARRGCGVPQWSDGAGARPLTRRSCALTLSKGDSTDPTVSRPMTPGCPGACRGWRRPHRVPGWRPMGRAAAAARDRIDRRCWSAWFLPARLRSDS